MPFWHCPHCGTPQPEAARCWVCRRSSTTCGTCRHFRRAIAGQLGYCGIDKRREPLRGDETRGCWETANAPGRPAPTRTSLIADTPAARTWTEVGTVSGAQDATGTGASPRCDGDGAIRDDTAPMPIRPVIDPPPPGLWGDIEA